ncbi:hypothetical protein LOK49_LG07G01041 [Camellia lanceoleosa]|uniref:Uncharacterized protein n=1 Tax=Camellia lanceoleosa TaxID=1840588 RepID=A0ACC0H256_9ERIC|nr:hypothetical protein LOK49_LG07G01041 [Camellia lanceoleosa]
MISKAGMDGEASRLSTRFVKRRKVGDIKWVEEKIKSSIWSYEAEMEDNSDMKSDRARDTEEWEAMIRESRSSKPRKPGNGEEAEGLDGLGRRRSTGDRNESERGLVAQAEWIVAMTSTEQEKNHVQSR